MNDAYLFGRKIPFPLSIYLGVDLQAWMVILILIYLLFIYKCIFWGFFTVFSIMPVLISLLVYGLHFSISLPAFGILVPTMTLVFFLFLFLLLDDSHLNWDGIISHCLFFFILPKTGEMKCVSFICWLCLYFENCLCAFFLWCSGSNRRPWTFSGKHAVGSSVHALFCASHLVLEAVSLSDWGGSGTHCRVQMALNLGSSCLCLLSDVITGMRHYIWLPLCSLAYFKTGFFASQGLVFQFLILTACHFVVRSTIGKYFLILDRLSLNPVDCFPGCGRTLICLTFGCLNLRVLSVFFCVHLKQFHSLNFNT